MTGEIVETRKCVWCTSSFEITKKQRELLGKIAPLFLGKRHEIPFPTLCPDCRNQRRLSIKNDSIFYVRQSSMSGKRLLSIYHPQSLFPVYDSDEWHGSSWDARSFGRDFDFNRPFFAQFKELCDLVPRRNLMASNCENCDYCGQLLNCKDCYLVINAAGNQRCMYMYRVINCSDCMDSLVSLNNELCYGCTDTSHCYRCSYCFTSAHCADATFLENCRSCNNCFMCSGLRNRSYCYKNKQLTSEGYQNVIAQYDLGSYSGLAKAQAEFQKFVATVPALFASLLQVDDVTGDNTNQARSCERVFDGSMLEDTLNSQFVQECKDTGDVNFGFQQSLHYEGLMVGAGSSDVAFCIDTWPNVSCLYYSVFCENSHHCFGCNGLQRAEYCILNKAYSREEYEALASRIVDHMRKTGEWGEFFPQPTLGTGYQESLASCYYPLTREQAQAKGFHWCEYTSPPPSVSRVLESGDLADSIDDVGQDAVNAAIRCAQSGKLFRVVQRELEYYRKQRIPLPRLHPYQRHLNRIRARNPRFLWRRPCANCGTELSTSFAPECKRQILCQVCFETEAY